MVLVAFPELVEQYAPHFSEAFSAAGLVQFKRYISGLLVSENKTVEGINRLLVQESRGCIWKYLQDRMHSANRSRDGTGAYAFHQTVVVRDWRRERFDTGVYSPIQCTYT
jgi:hypothetical protein